MNQYILTMRHRDYDSHTYVWADSAVEAVRQALLYAPDGQLVSIVGKRFGH